MAVCCGVPFTSGRSFWADPCGESEEAATDSVVQNAAEVCQIPLVRGQLTNLVPFYDSGDTAFLWEMTSTCIWH